MAQPSQGPPDGLDRQKMKRMLVPALAVAAIVVLVGLVVYVSDAAAPKKMSDGSSGAVDDPDLKEKSEGVKYRDLKVGTGDECQSGAITKVRYTGWLEDGTVFDTNETHPQPTEFALKTGRSGVPVPGWIEGVAGMKKDGVRKLVIAPVRGYGEYGNPPKVKGNSTLVYEVKLLEFTPGIKRSPPPADLTKLSDGTEPGSDDPGLKPIGTEGLKYRDLKAGTGPVCSEGAGVVMDYTGWLTTGGKYFDSSWKPGSDGPLDMSLGRLIKGWQQGVPGMRVGGVRKLVIPSDLAYGPTGTNGIPGGATLVFEIELLGVK